MSMCNECAAYSHGVQGLEDVDYGVLLALSGGITVGALGDAYIVKQIADNPESMLKMLDNDYARAAAIGAGGIAVLAFSSEPMAMAFGSGLAAYAVSSVISGMISGMWEGNGIGSPKSTITIGSPKSTVTIGSAEYEALKRSQQYALTENKQIAALRDGRLSGIKDARINKVPTKEKKSNSGVNINY